MHQQEQATRLPMRPRWHWVEDDSSWLPETFIASEMFACNYANCMIFPSNLSDRLSEALAFPCAAASVSVSI